jgi:hypothetical protein
VNQREYDAAVAIVKANPVVGKLIDTLMEKLADLETRLAQAETTKGRGSAPAPTVADAIGDVIQKDLARRRSTQVRKTTSDGDLHPHFLSDAIATRKSRERAAADADIRAAGDDLLQAVRKKAGL